MFDDLPGVETCIRIGVTFYDKGVQALDLGTHSFDEFRCVELLCQRCRAARDCCQKNEYILGRSKHGFSLWKVVLAGETWHFSKW